MEIQTFIENVLERFGEGSSLFSLFIFGLILRSVFRLFSKSLPQNKFPGRSDLPFAQLNVGGSSQKQSPGDVQVVVKNEDSLRVPVSLRPKVTLPFSKADTSHLILGKDGKLRDDNGVELR